MTEPLVYAQPSNTRVLASFDAPRPFAYDSYFVDQDGLVVKQRASVRKFVPDIYISRYQDCVIHGGESRTFSLGAPVRESLSHGRTGIAHDPERATELPSTSLDVAVTYSRDWRNFYHWTLQCLFSMYALTELDKSPGRQFLLPAEAESRADMFSLLGLDARNTLYLEEGRFYRFPSLSFTNAMISPPHHLLPAFARHMLDRAGVQPGLARSIYISRRDSPKRSMVNERAIERLLESLGVVVVVLSELSFAEKMSLFLGCDQIIGAHGAGLTYMIFSRPGTQVLELMPTTIKKIPLARLAGACGLAYSLVSIFNPDEVDGMWHVPDAAIAQVITSSA